MIKFDKVFRQLEKVFFFRINIYIFHVAKKKNSNPAIMPLKMFIVVPKECASIFLRKMLLTIHE